MRLAGNRAVACALLISIPTAAQPAAAASASPGYPHKPIRLVSGNPGSPPDVVARAFAERLAASFGQPIIVDNRPGAIGTIALHAIVKAPADGYTVGSLSMPHVLAPSLLPRLPFDMVRDLSPIAQIAWASHILVVRSASPWKSVSDLIESARVNPGKLTFASGGNATPAHVSGELLKQQARVDLRHIPYKGAIAGITAVLSDQVDLMFAAATASGSHIRSGRLRALATPAPRRVEEFPDVPTMIELGFAGFEIREWHGIVAPATTPREIIAKLAAELARIASMPEIKSQLGTHGLSPVGDSGPDAFGRLVRAELDRWGTVARTAGLRAD